MDGIYVKTTEILFVHVATIFELDIVRLYGIFGSSKYNFFCSKPIISAEEKSSKKIS